MKHHPGIFTKILKLWNVFIIKLNGKEGSKIIDATLVQL